MVSLLIFFFTYLFQLTANVGKVQIHKTKINYLEFQPKESDIDYKGKTVFLFVFSLKFMTTLKEISLTFE